ncbi:MAG: hypothetical protein ACYCSN_19200 [Acidobacteriaceae bacterium]
MSVRKAVLKYGKQAWFFIRKTEANTAETNFNLTAWTVGAVIAFTIIGGALWFVFGSATSQVQSMATNTFSQLSSQNGLNTMATNAEKQLAGTNSGAGSTFTGGGFTAP